MKIWLLTIGRGQPAWIAAGFAEYQKRMPRDYEITLIEIAALKRTENANLAKIKQEESQKLFEKIPPHSLPIALDPRGKKVSTESFSKLLQEFYQAHQNIAFLIGGPEGLSDELLAKVSLRWSLSDLTFPHGLVRIILAEQIYRTMTIHKNLPYHR